MKFENRIQRSRHVLTKMDKKIIEYIQTHELDENFSTINSLAYAIGTSPATITRFSGKLNYANFQDMKFNLQHEKSEKVVENAPLVQISFIDIIKILSNKRVNLFPRKRLNV